MSRKSNKPQSWHIPQRYERCANCEHVRRYGQYNNQFNCDKHCFVTKPHALCDDFVAWHIARIAVMYECKAMMRQSWTKQCAISLKLLNFQFQRARHGNRETLPADHS